MRRSLALILGLCAATIYATGTTVVQSLDGPGGMYTGYVFSVQTFQVPIEEPALIEWTFDLAGRAGMDGFLDFSIRSFDTPSRALGDVVFSAVVPWTTSQRLVTLPVNTFLIPGTVYAAVYDTRNDDGPNIRTKLVGDYSGGSISLSTGATPEEIFNGFFSFPGADQVFTATFEATLPAVDPGIPPVDPGDASSVPEPATLALVGLSLLGLVAARKHLGGKR